MSVHASRPCGCPPDWSSGQLPLVQHLPLRVQQKLALRGTDEDSIALMLTQMVTEYTEWWPELTHHPRGYRMELYAIETRAEPSPDLEEVAGEHGARLHPFMTLPDSRPPGEPVHVIKAAYNDPPPDNPHAALRLAVEVMRVTGIDTPADALRYTSRQAIDE